MTKNIITNTDSYKFLNNTMLNGVTNIFSYFEPRKGAKYPKTTMASLQYFLMEYLQGVQVTPEKLEFAKFVALNHLGSKDALNVQMWQTIIDEYGGKLPITIKALPEGLSVPESNVLMTIQLTKDDARLVGLVNHLETLLTNVWAGCTVATKSKFIKQILIKYGNATCDNNNHIAYQLHDFAQRSVKCPEQASVSGLAHLINFFGTDTVLAWELAHDYYSGKSETIGHSVFATEHNYMMYKGVEGELDVLKEIITARPDGIISVVSDTYNIYRFVDYYVGLVCKEDILKRNGTFVVRPDSVTEEHNTPAKMSLWILNSLWTNFGGTINSKGYKVLDPHVRCIYGDSLTEESIEEILYTIKEVGFASENMVFGCGSYLLDKHNRDTQKFAYKSSAMKINGNWVGTCKDPIGGTYKTSKKGRLKLVKTGDNYSTLTEYDEGYNEAEDCLVEVFKDGFITKYYSLDEIRENSSI